MNCISFFLTPHQFHDARRGVPEHPLQLAARSKAGETVKLVQGLMSFHRPIPYSLHPDSVKFSKNIYRQQMAQNDPH